VILVGVQMPAQPFPPGYVDPAPLLAAAALEIGEANLTCITFSGTGYGAAVGQTFENAVNIDWPRIDALANYTRTINWEAGTSVETFDRKPGLNPASWKYGLGWQDGTPIQKALRQTHIVNGRHAWHIDGDGPPVAVPPELAELYQLDLWLNPPGFLKAARLPGANPVALWRWEQLEKGRDGNVVSPEKVHVVAITMLGKYRVDATINSKNQITRIKTTVNEPALGDFNIEHESTEQMTFGGVKWPIAWHSHHGWDDNWQFYRQSTGHNGYGGKFPTVQPNACGEPVPVPPAASASAEAPPVTVEKRAQLRAAHGETGYRGEMAAGRGIRGLQLRGRAGALRHHRQRAHPPRLLRAAAAARGGNADGVSAGRAHRVPGRPLRHARAAASGAAARHADAGHPGGADGTGRDDAGPGAREARAMDRVRDGAEGVVELERAHASLRATCSMIGNEEVLDGIED